MKYMTINNQKVAFDDEKNVLSVIRKAGINLPTFCYHSELSTYGACRMCVVEDDRGKIFASCSEVPRDGMVIYTNTPKLQHHRKMILELMLSAHCRECTTCKKNGDCTLQNLAKQLGVSYIRFENNKPQIPIDESSDCIVIDKNKCILCGDCVRTCEEIQGLGILDFAYRGSKMQVMPAFDRKMAETACVGCGQCRVVCPTGAITIKHNIHPVWEALADKNTRVVVQIAPAVRVAVGDKFGIPKGENSLGKLVAALRRMGFDEIYDTDFGADLTIMEESKEFLERVESGEKLPLFTSCCPAWVKFCEQKYPELRANISTCRSPQQMFGAVLKEEARNNKLIGKSLEAKLTIYPNEQVRGLLTAVDADIPQLLIVSPDYYEVMSANAEVPEAAVKFDDVAILVEKADGQTCDRCRQIRKDVGVDEKLPHLCGRCAHIVEENYPEAVAEGFE